MIETLTIALWAHLFCGPWSDASKVFGWLKSWASHTNQCTGKQRLPFWIRHPLIECGMCHAVWVAGGLQVWRLAHGTTFDAGNALMVLGASFAALLLDDFAELRDKWKNA